MEFHGFYTTKGQRLAAKLASGNATLTVTRILAGSGETGEGAGELNGARQHLAVNAPIHNNNIATISATLTAAGAGTDYSLTEIGVYALDPSEGEILYKIYRLTMPIPIAAGSSAVFRFYLDETVSAADEVTVACSPAGLVTEEDFYRLLRMQVSNAMLTLHVSKSGSDESGIGSEASPFLTIQKAVNSLPKVLPYSVTIRVHEGTYDELVTVSSILNGAGFVIEGASGETVQIKAITLWDCNCKFQIKNLELTGTQENGYNPSLEVGGCAQVIVSGVRCVQPVESAHFGAFRFAETPLVKLLNCTISNKPVALDVVAGAVFIDDDTTGTGNTVAIRCGSGWGRAGGFVQKGGSTISGSETSGFGGQIF